MNFGACCPVVNETVISRNFLQINAADTEIQRRVDCFIDRKREEININNIQNYRADVNNSEEPNDADMTCSRVCSSAFTTKGSKTHLKGNND